MKSTLQNNFSIKKLMGFLLVLLFILPAQSFAGDIKLKGYFQFQKAMKGREQPLFAEIENIENFPVEGANFKLTIKHQLSANIEYEWSRSLGTVNAKGSAVIEADTSWTPQQTGKYKLFYQLTSQNDINPLNDTASFNVEVINPYYFIHFGFSQFNFKNPFQQENSNTGSADFNVIASGMPLYANFMVSPDNNNSHTEWLVQNVVLHSVEDTNNIHSWLDLEKIGIQNGFDLKYLWYDYKITPEPIKDPFISNGLYFAKVGDFNYNVGGDVLLNWEFSPTTYIPQVNWDDGFQVKTWYYRGCEVPNIDLDSSTYNPAEMAGEVGDWNCCAPAAAANSLQWLEENDSNIPKINKTHREKLKIFNQLSKRANERGLNTANTIKGKLAYIDSFQLPIHVKWQGVPYDTTIASPKTQYKHFAESKNESHGAFCDFDWLASEMKKGEDVELKFGWYDSTGTRHNGHWVVVSGVVDIKTAKGLYVKDDQDQSAEGGTRQTFVNWVTNDEGRPRLVGFKALNNYCWVESVVSESYDSTITYPFEIPETIKNIKIEKLVPANSFFDVFYQIECSEKRLFSFDIIPNSKNKFLNVKVKNKETEKEDWVIKNMFIPALEFSERISAWFSWEALDSLKSGSEERIEFVYEITDDAKTTDDFNPDYWQEITITGIPVSKSLNIDETDVSEGIQIAFINQEQHIGELLSMVYRGVEMPNIDLDSSLFNPESVGNYAGDKNACAPASAANSLEWLESKFPQINSELTLREKMQELSKMMQRTNNNGVNRTNFIKAKLDFIDKYKLPIHVKFQSWKLGTDSIPSPNVLYTHFAENKTGKDLRRPTWEWLKQEMENNEDVEMELGYYDLLGIRKGGHWITVSGIVEFEGKRGIYFNDDLNQLSENGNRIQYATWDTAWSYPYIKELSNEKASCYVESVVSESFDEEVIFIPFYSEVNRASKKLNLKVYKNPSSKFDPITINFDISKPGKVQLLIYNISGKLVYSEETEFASSGSKTIKWNGAGNNNLITENGAYIVKIETETRHSATKIIRQD